MPGRRRTSLVADPEHRQMLCEDGNEAHHVVDGGGLSELVEAGAPVSH